LCKAYNRLGVSFLCYFYQALKALNKGNSNRGEHREYENVKVSVIVYADTIIDPGAVVIKPFNASIANRAVLAAAGANSKTICT
jgi:hypothetical protein